MRILQLVALAIGAISFGFLVDRFGWDAMQSAVLDAGWWFLWIALIDLAGASCDAGAVWCFARPVSYRRAFAAQVSGMAINRLTPANSLGEAIKVTMLVDHVPKHVALAAIVKFNLATLYVALATIVTGVPLTLITLDLPQRIELAVWIATGVLVVLGVALALLVRRGAIGSLVRALRSIGAIDPARAERWTTRVAALDATIRGFGDPWSRRGVLFVAGSRVLHFAATIAVLRAAAVPLTPPVVIGMLSVGILVTWLSNVVPLGIGVADGTNYFLYGALGASPLAGLAFTMVNRTRTAVVAAMGLAVMLLAHLFDRRSPSAVRRTPDELSDARTP